MIKSFTITGVNEAIPKPRMNIAFEGNAKIVNKAEQTILKLFGSDKYRIE